MVVVTGLSTGSLWLEPSMDVVWWLFWRELWTCDGTLTYGKLDGKTAGLLARMTLWNILYGLCQMDSFKGHNSNGRPSGTCLLVFVMVREFLMVPTLGALLVSSLSRAVFSSEKKATLCDSDCCKKVEN